LAVDGWAYQVQQPTHQRPVYQLHIIKPPLDRDSEISTSCISVLSVCSSVCLSVCRQNAKNANFSKKTKQFRALISYCRPIGSFKKFGAPPRQPKFTEAAAAAIFAARRGASDSN